MKSEIFGCSEVCDQPDLEFNSFEISPTSVEGRQYIFSFLFHLILLYFHNAKPGLSLMVFFYRKPSGVHSFLDQILKTAFINIVT